MTLALNHKRLTFGFAVLALALFGLVFAAPHASAQADAPEATAPTTATDAAIESAADQLAAAMRASNDPYQQLSALLKFAPNRQVGQPGNAVLDRFVQRYFEGLVASENDPAKYAAAIAKWQAAEKLLDELNDVRMGSEGDHLAEDLKSKTDRLSIEAYEKSREAALALAGHWQTGRVVYDTAAFIPGRASLRLTDGAETRIYQMAPNLVEPANLPEGGFAGPIVYVGSASPADLAGKSLQNAAVLVDFNSAMRWIDAAQLGASVILVLEPRDGVDMLFTEAAQKQVEATISVPRFFIKRADLSATFGADWEKTVGQQPRIEIAQEPGVWKSVPVASDWLFVPGSAEPKNDKTQFELDPGRQLVMVQAYKDSRSIVPELSPGATGAGNVVTLLRMVEEARGNQPVRPTLYVLTNDHTNGLLGEHFLGFAAFGETAAIAAEIGESDTAAVTERFIAELYNNEVNQQFLEPFRVAEAKVAGRQFYYKSPAVDGDLEDGRNRSRDLRTRLAFELVENRRRIDAGRPPLLTPAEVAEHERRIPLLEQETDDYNKLAELFNRFGTKSEFNDLPEDLKQMTRDLFKQIANRASVKAKVMFAARDQLITNLAIRPRLSALTITDADTMPTTGAEAFAATYRPLRMVAAIPLDLSYGSPQLGLFHMDMQVTDDVAEQEASTRTGWLARFIISEAESMAEETRQPVRIIETLRGLPWQGYLGGKFAFASRAFFDHRVPALTLTNVYDNRPYVYSPDDTAENVDRATFNLMSTYANNLLTRVINADALGATVRSNVGTVRSLSALVTVTQKDKFTVQVPKTVVPNGLIVAMTAGGALPGAVFPNNARMFGQVSPWPVFLTDTRGSVLIRGGTFRQANLLAFSYTPDYRRMVTALDFADGEKRLPSVLSANTSQFYISPTIISSEFIKVDLLGLTAPLSLAPAASLDILDAGQDSAFISFGGTGITLGGTERAKTTVINKHGVASIYIDPGTSFKLKGGAGLALNSTTEESKGVGFASSIGRLANLPVISARDMLRLTSERLDMLAKRGVIDESGKAYMSMAQAELDMADAALAAGENDQLMLHAERARGYGFRAYTRALGTINDLIKAVVIFLALVIPFCFFVTKLITPFTDANRQLGLFAVVFFTMAMLLRFLHPAFKVARTPEVVILAFIILGLALFVASVLIGRFNSSMTQAVEESQLSESVEASQGRLAGVAFLVGVNNMRRRRIRTTLTCATIVLVTFTMLSVISVGQDIEPTSRRTDSVAPYSGLLYAREGLTAIDSLQLRRLKAHLQEHGDVVARAWAERKGKYGEYLPYDLRPVESFPGAALDTLRPRVLVGLEAAEGDFLGAMPLVAGHWFVSDDASEVVLSVDAAQLLGISAERVDASPVPVVINGRKLRLVGLLDDKRMSEVKDLAGVPLLPMLSQAKLSGASGGDSGGDVSASGSLFAAGTEVARPSDVAFVAIDVARSFGDAEYRMLAMRAHGDTPAEAAATAWKAANDLIQFQDARLTVGLSREFTPEGQDQPVQAGQYTLASSSSTEVGGVLKVAIPIILAATIILNTMLGSVMERRREVGIYNAIGLNPGHVMMFFLAESLVFGLVGSVAGYLIGQALSLVVVQFPELGLNLNYSSLSVLVVIFLSIATVLLSTVYPAMMAARAAVPSGQRRWSLPQPEGDTIHLKFPFSYDADRVMGVCAYLHDYMRQNSEASTGKFLAKLGPVGRVPLTEDAKTDGEGDVRPYAMVFDIAPAPFDLGVNQKMEIYAYFDSHVHAHMLAVYLTRVSGERGNWVTVNQPFLESLRKRLLGWRSQKAQTQKAFYEQGLALFAQAQELPTVDAKREQA